MADLKAVESIFIQALAHEGDRRRQYLDSACGGDTDVRREIEELLDADGDVKDQFERAVASAMASTADEDLVSRRLGAYRIVREIGHGGMGAVFLGVRADAEFEKQVAIKVIKRGMDSLELLRRFRHERQILAQLDHPYIARLLDGGKTPDGRPYFVMEYVDGQPLTAYCDSHGFNTEARCRLFMKVCEAVSYAHRNLVVHRDLKPGNILVTADGSPKLLDFGIAKLLGSAPSAPETVAQMRMLTPDYASPEQVLGQPVTTATDVYSLGAVLFQLLTGTAAHRFETHDAVELMRVVCQTDPARPSTRADRSVTTDLDGDLDNIVLMAMRREPERRYASVDQFRQDIEWHFAKLPVLARGDGLGYRASRFVRRHSVALTAAAIVIASVAGGVVVSLQQARIARTERAIAVRERDQAERQRMAAEREHANAERQRALAVTERDHAEVESKEAVAQRARAEKRLHDLIGLANKSLFDVEEGLAHQPGATDARKQLVKATLDYLDRLAADETTDLDLAEAVSSGYLKMGDVLGRPRKPNLGDAAGALESYRKAARIMEQVRRNRDDLHAAILWTEAQQRIALRTLESADSKGAAEVMRALNRELERLLRRYPEDKEVLVAAASIYSLTSDVGAISRAPEALSYAQRATATYEKLARSYPEDDSLQEALGVTYSSLALSLSGARDLQGAIEYDDKSLAVRERRIRAHPDDVLAKRDLVLSYARVADMLGGPVYTGGARDDVKAAEYYGKAAALAESNVKADPDNQLAQEDFAIVLMRYGACTPVAADREKSLQILQRSAALLNGLLAKTPKQRQTRFNRIINCEYLARRLEELGRYGEAAESARLEVQQAGALLRDDPDYVVARARLMSGYDYWSRTLAEAGRGDDALAAARQAVDAAGQLASAPGANEITLTYRAVASGRLGEIYTILGRRPEAREAFERALAEWKNLAAMPGHTSVDKMLRAAEARLALSVSALTKP